MDQSLLPLIPSRIRPLTTFYPGLSKTICTIPKTKVWDEIAENGHRSSHRLALIISQSCHQVARGHLSVGRRTFSRHSPALIRQPDEISEIEKRRPAS
jgi:hypothetical protein